MVRDYSQYGITGKAKGRTVKNALEFTAEEAALSVEASGCSVDMHKETVRN